MSKKNAMLKCWKRNGEIVDFIKSKIEKAIKKAFDFEKVDVDNNTIKKIILKTKNKFKKKIKKILLELKIFKMLLNYLWWKLIF